MHQAKANGDELIGTTSPSGRWMPVASDSPATGNYLHTPLLFLAGGGWLLATCLQPTTISLSPRSTTPSLQGGLVASNTPATRNYLQKPSALEVLIFEAMAAAEDCK